MRDPIGKALMSNDSANEVSMDGSHQQMNGTNGTTNGSALKTASTGYDTIDSAIALKNHCNHSQHPITNHTNHLVSPNANPSTATVFGDTNGIHLDATDEPMASDCDESNDNHIYDNNRSSVVMTNGDINDNDDITTDGDLVIDENVVNDQLLPSHDDVSLWMNESNGQPFGPKTWDETVDQDGDMITSNDTTVDVSDNKDIRTNYSEFPDHLRVYVYVRQVNDIDIDFKEDSIEVRYKTETQEDKDVTYLWRKELFGPIIVSECWHKLTKSNIEIFLKKKNSTLMWNTLERPVVKDAIQLGYTNGPQLPVAHKSYDSQQEASDQRINDWLKSSDGGFKKVDDSTSSKDREIVLVPNDLDNIGSQLSPSPSRTVKPKLIGFTGLQNLGNTCFMNSVVQCLSNTDPFRDYFTSGQYAHDINTTNAFGSGGVICKTFADVLKQLWAGTDTSIAPHKLKERMGEKCPTFSSYIQQDAQEFCAYLLDVLHEDLNKRRERPAIKDDNSDESDEPIDDQVLADESWRTFGLMNHSIVTEQFYGQYKSKLVCPTCQKVSVTFDPFVYLSLPLPKPKVDYEVYFFKRDSNGMSTSKPTKYYLKLPKECFVKNLLDEVSAVTGVNSSLLRCLQCYASGAIEKFHQPSWSLHKPETGKYLLVFELMGPKEDDDVEEYFVVQRLAKPKKSDNCAKCDKNSSWDNIELKSCQKCYRVAYCDKTCQTEHWPTHKKDCIYKPEITGMPFIITVPKSKLTYRNLWTIIYSYARHSVDLSVPLNLNEFPTPPPFKLRIYQDWNREETSELLEPDAQDSDVDNDNDNDNRYDTQIKANHYYLAMDWTNSPKFGDHCIKVETKCGISSDTDYKHRSEANEVIGLEDCLQLHTKPETLTADNPWYCPKCKEQRQANKQITLWRLPQVLVIQLKRFSFRNSFWREKLDSMVRYPIHGLDMSQYYVRTDNNPDCPPVYDLFGVVNHFGSLFGGHYTAYAKTSDNYKNIGWRCFDDSRVESVDEDSVVTRNAYMLFYKLRDN